MKIGATIFLLMISVLGLNAQNPNTLTAQEKKEGWQLLFDGKTTHGWHGAQKTTFPTAGWHVQDNMLVIEPSTDGKNAGGDILTDAEYNDFDLRFEFKLTEGANSGLKYYVTEYPNEAPFGLEYQVLDDDRHPDAKMGRDGNRTVGSLYDLIPAQNKTANPIGQWNTGRIVAKGQHVEHWLNGKKVVAYERGSQAFREAVAQSKYKAGSYNRHERFGEAPNGHILLQDHGNRVYFRNLKIKTL